MTQAIYIQTISKNCLLDFADEAVFDFHKKNYPKEASFVIVHPADFVHLIEAMYNKYRESGGMSSFRRETDNKYMIRMAQVIRSIDIKEGQIHVV